VANDGTFKIPFQYSKILAGIRLAIPDLRLINY
jgi:hypothetical protein